VAYLVVGQHVAGTDNHSEARLLCGFTTADWPISLLVSLTKIKKEIPLTDQADRYATDSRPLIDRLPFDEMKGAEFRRSDELARTAATRNLDDFTDVVVLLKQCRTRCLDENQGETGRFQSRFNT
jgi:hypothetical protein